MRRVRAAAGVVVEMNGVYDISMLALATAAISVTISRAKIFKSAREYVAGRSEWFGELISCHYCLSHWVAITMVLIYRPLLVQAWLPVDVAVMVFVVVALSAVIGGVVIRLTFPDNEREKNLQEQIRLLRDALENTKRKLVSLQTKEGG